MLESAVGFAVAVFVVSFLAAKNRKVLLQVGFGQEDASAMWAFVVVVVAVGLLRQLLRLNGYLCRFFCRPTRIRAIPLRLPRDCRANRLFWTSQEAP